MRNAFFIMVCLCLTMSSLKAQKWQISAGINYQSALHKQTSPAYFIVDPPLPPYVGTNGYRFSSQYKEFSLSSGFSPEVGIGYRLNELFLVEINIAYFHNQTTTDGESIATSDWTYNCLSMSPTIVLSKHIGKSAVEGKFGIFLGRSVLTQEVMDWQKCEFDPAIVIGTQFSIGYNTPLSNVTSFKMEVGLLQYNYTPHTATLYNLSANPPYNKTKISYHNSFNGVDANYYSENRGYEVSSDQIERIEETIIFSSLNIQASLIFHLLNSI